MITITLTITNTATRNITYSPIMAPPVFSECAVDIGTLKPEESAVVTCDGTLPELSPEESAFTFSIENTPEEHQETHAMVTVMVKDLPVVPTSPPPSSPPPPPPSESPEPPVGPTLPITGNSAGLFTAIGGGAIAAGGLMWAALRRRTARN